MGSKSLNGAIAALCELGIGQFTVGSLVALGTEQQQFAGLVAKVEPLCRLLVDVVGLQGSDIASLRAAIATLELLGRLPRPLWTRRSPPILDEANRAVLSRAALQASGLNRRRGQLEAEFHLQLLPTCGELRTYGADLRSASFFSSLLRSKCREARRTFRIIYRSGPKKGRREMADGLLRCAQYLADAEALVANPTLKSVCGPHYSGIETPFAELVEVSTWVTDVRQRLAPFGETGLVVREFLFGATVDQLDKLQGIAAQVSFASLTAAIR